MLPKIKESEILNGVLLKSKPRMRFPKRKFSSGYTNPEEKHSNSTDKISIPRSLVMHRKNKSNDYTLGRKIELPTVDEILIRILHTSESPVKNSPNLDLPPHYPLSLSPSKFKISKKKSRPKWHKNHFRSDSPLKQFNDRIFQLKRLIGK